MRRSPRLLPEANVESLQHRIAELEDIATQFSSELENSKCYVHLADLPNQILFYDRIRQAIERGCRHDQLAVVLIIDIELYSQINAGLGRSGGDELLGQFAIDEVQGYLLKKPVDPAAIESMILDPDKQAYFPANVVQLRP